MIIIYTDGSCITSKKKNLIASGGWCHYIIFPESDKQNILVSGSEKNTTNNRMELMAVLESFEWIQSELNSGLYKVLIYSDSRYVVEGTENWMYDWVKSNFMIDKTHNKDRINADLWRQMYNIVNNRWKNLIKLKWIKAHDVSEYNNLVDEYARNEALG